MKTSTAVIPLTVLLGMAYTPSALAQAEPLEEEEPCEEECYEPEYGADPWCLDPSDSDDKVVDFSLPGNRAWAKEGFLTAWDADLYGLQAFTARAELVSIRDIQADPASYHVLPKGTVTGKAGHMAPLGKECAVKVDHSLPPAPEPAVSGAVEVVGSAGQPANQTNTQTIGDINVTVDTSGIEALLREWRESQEEDETASEARDLGPVQVGFRYRALFPIGGDGEFRPGHLFLGYAGVRLGGDSNGAFHGSVLLGGYHRPFGQRTLTLDLLTGEFDHPVQEHAGAAPGGADLVIYHRETWTDRRSRRITGPDGGFAGGLALAYELPVPRAEFLLGGSLLGIQSESPVVTETSGTRTYDRPEVLHTFGNGQPLPDEDQPTVDPKPDEDLANESTEADFRGGLLCFDASFGGRPGDGPVSLRIGGNACYSWGNAMTGQTEPSFVAGVEGSVTVYFP